MINRGVTKMGKGHLLLLPAKEQVCRSRDTWKTCRVGLKDYTQKRGHLGIPRGEC